MSSPGGAIDSFDGSPTKRKAAEIASDAAISGDEPGQVPSKGGRYVKDDTNNTDAIASANENLASNDNTPKLRNSAFVFIKPHANTERTRAMVTATLSARNLRIEREGEITAEQIDKDMLIDQHYYAIASKATILKPKDIPVPEKKFEELLGVSWQKVLEDNMACNALDACSHFDVDAAGLKAIWSKSKWVKLGGGFYCGLVESSNAEKTPVYVFNGFFMEMRAMFVKPGSSIHYYIIDWDGDDLSWKDFRSQILGPTDPKEAPTGSIRASIYKDWKNLGLEKEPYISENGIHASASPFEALAEKMNWLKTAIPDDPFGSKLLASGITKETIEAWSVDPVVNGKSLFDQLEDTNWGECIGRAIGINATASTEKTCT